MRSFAIVLLAASVALAVPAWAATPAEIDRLRMHAAAGRDDDALARLRALAAAGAPEATRALGLALLARNEAVVAAEGRAALERAANGGDAAAMLALGKTALLGAPGLARDGAIARRWLDGAARAGDAVLRAQSAYYLGLVERGGVDGRADAARAAEYFGQAAEQGVADAMFQLGNLYASGEGVDQDARQAMRWYLRAAALDHPGAIQELAFAFERGDTLLPKSALQADNMRLALEHALRHPRGLP